MSDDPATQITEPEPSDDNVLTDEELGAAGADADDAQPTEDDASTSPEAVTQGDST